MDSLWRHRIFQQLFWAHALSLVGSGLTSLSLGLLAHELVGASASEVLGITLAIRIIVIVISSPWTGRLAARWGSKRVMVLSDIFRALLMVGFLYANAVWQIYVLAIFLNLGSAIFTPIYRAVIPEVVTPKQYPRAVAIGSIAYDSANILGPSLGALVIAAVGFRGNFIVDGVTFILSALLLLGLPRLGAEAVQSGDKPKVSATHGMKAMFRRLPLRDSIYLALQTSVAGAFVIVATVEFVKNDLGLSDTFYAWIMAAFGIGSVCGAITYGKMETTWRNRIVRTSGPTMILALAIAAIFPTYAAVTFCWWLIGTGYSVFGIRGSELLAENSQGEERAHIYAAHFALSHAGWGITYPLAGFLATKLGFSTTAGIFAGLLFLVSLRFWLRRQPSQP